MKKIIVKYLVLGPSVVGLLILGVNLWLDPEWISSWFEDYAEEGVGVPQALLLMPLTFWMAGLMVFPVINFFFYIISRLIRGRLSYFIFNPLPFFIVLIGFTAYRDQALPTDIGIYVGAYAISLVCFFVFLALRAAWKAAPSKQKAQAVIGYLAVLLVFGTLDTFAPPEFHELLGTTGKVGYIFSAAGILDLIVQGFFVYVLGYIFIGSLIFLIKFGVQGTKELIDPEEVKEAFANLGKISSAIKGLYCKNCGDALSKGELVNSSEQWRHQTQKGDKDLRHSVNPPVQHEIVRYFCDKCELDYHAHVLVDGRERKIMKLTYVG